MCVCVLAHMLKEYREMMSEVCVCVCVCVYVQRNEEGESGCLYVCVCVCVYVSE